MAHLLCNIHLEELYQDWLIKAVDRIKLGMNGCKPASPGVMPVGVGRAVWSDPQAPGAKNGDEQATGVYRVDGPPEESDTLLGVVGNSQPAKS